MMYHNKYFGLPSKLFIYQDLWIVSYEFQALDHSYYPTENNTAKEVLSPN